MILWKGHCSVHTRFTAKQIENIRRQLGVDRPYPVQMGIFLKQIATADFGVSWSTNELATPGIRYGRTTAYEAGTIEKSTLAKQHSIVLHGLACGTVYHYEVRARDAAGNAASQSVTYTVAEETSLAPADVWVWRRGESCLVGKYLRSQPFPVERAANVRLLAERMLEVEDVTEILDRVPAIGRVLLQEFTHPAVKAHEPRIGLARGEGRRGGHVGQPQLARVGDDPGLRTREGDGLVPELVRQADDFPVTAAQDRVDVRALLLSVARLVNLPTKARMVCVRVKRRVADQSLRDRTVEARFLARVSEIRADVDRVEAFSEAHRGTFFCFASLPAS